MTRTAEDSWLIRSTLMTVACGLAFGSAVGVGLSYLIDRLKGR